MEQVVVVGSVGEKIVRLTLLQGGAFVFNTSSPVGKSLHVASGQMKDDQNGSWICARNKRHSSIVGLERERSLLTFRARHYRRS